MNKSKTNFLVYKECDNSHFFRKEMPCEKKMGWRQWKYIKMIKKGTNSEFRTLVCKGRKRLVFLQPSKLDSGPSGSTEQKCWCLRTITSCLRTIEVAYGPSQVASGPSGCLRTIRLPPDHVRKKNFASPWAVVLYSRNRVHEQSFLTGERCRWVCECAQLCAPSRVDAHINDDCPQHVGVCMLSEYSVHWCHIPPSFQASLVVLCCQPYRSYCPHNPANYMDIQPPSTDR